MKHLRVASDGLEELSVYQQRSQTSEMSEQHRVLTITCATGCGKSTGVPKIFLEAPAVDGSELALKRTSCTQLAALQPSPWLRAWRS